MIDNPSPANPDLTEGKVDSVSSVPAEINEPAAEEENTDLSATDSSADDAPPEESSATEADVAASSAPETDAATDEAGAEESPEHIEEVDESQEEIDSAPDENAELADQSEVSSADSIEESEPPDAADESEGEADDSEETAVGDEDDASEQAEVQESEEAEDESNKHWYVVKVQSGREDSIKEAIERRVKIEGLEEFFGQIVIPTDKEIVKVRSQRKVREKKRFPGYIMAEVEYNDQILYLFRETSGVGDFVGGGINHPPQPMSENEVKRMIGPKAEDDDKPVDREGQPSPFDIGDHVKIKDGVFSGMEGEVKELMETKGQIRVETMVIGRPVSVELEYWQVEEV